MKSADIMNVNLEMLLETETILEAARLMADAGVGFLPICDEELRVVGVVTDRDLTVRALAKGLDAGSATVDQVMTSPAITWPVSAEIRGAEELMAQERLSRLVVTDDAGHPLGVLSIVDVVEKTHDRHAFETVRAVLARDALGPRGGASRQVPLLKDDPVARALPPPSPQAKVRETVFTGGHRSMQDLREFPT